MELTKSIAAAEAQLALTDSHLAKLIKLQSPIVINPRSDYFASLCRSIIGQQISVAAATAIYDRLNVLTKLDPTIIVRLGREEVKKVGLSHNKVQYIYDLAQHFALDPLTYNHLDKLSDEQITSELTRVKGIGVWTAQMFLMFTLARLDVFPVDDGGIQRALKKLYGWQNIPTKDKMIKLADEWRPYRSVACWHLWQSLKSIPV